MPVDSRTDGIAYGLLGLPLAFVALPLYVQLPPHLAERHALPLGALGLLLLAVRAGDALIDPLLGRWADRRLDAGAPAALRLLAGAAVLILLGVAALFHLPAHWTAPAVLAGVALLLWPLGLAQGFASILHQAWGSRLGGSGLAQARRVAWREGAALLGVILASLLPGWLGLGATGAVLAAGLLLGLLALRLAAAPEPLRAPPPPPAAHAAADRGPPLGAAFSAWRDEGFRALMAVYLLNGIAAAIPATLVVFFVRDRLQWPGGEGPFLAIYFVAGAVSMPFWLRVVARCGLVAGWALGILLAVAGFAGALTLQAGEGTGFFLVCLASGLALGADLCVPGALLARLACARSGAGAEGEAPAGLYAGWWAAAGKLNLALAAGLALPVLELAGYRPGSADERGLAALSLAYAGLPCVLKLAAGAALWRWRGRLERTGPADTEPLESRR